VFFLNKLAVVLEVAYWGSMPDIFLSVITPRLIKFWSAEKLVVVLKHRGGDERLCVVSKDQSSSSSQLFDEVRSIVESTRE